MRITSHGGNTLAAGRRYGLRPEDFIDFSASINPIGPSARAIERIAGEIPSIARYPDPECSELVEELSRHLAVHRSHVLVGNGGAEVIFATMRALSPARTIIVAPTFSEYAHAAEALGIPVVRVLLSPENGFGLDPAVISATVSMGDAIVVCNPNNPTANLTNAETLGDLLRRTETAGAYLIVDEAFMEFVGDRAVYSMVPLTRYLRGLIVIGSLTKFYALPGLRIGYAVGCPELVDKITRQIPPWSVNSLAQAAAVESLRDKDYAEATLTFISSEREWFAGELAGIPGVIVWPPSANYILFEVRGLGLNATQLADHLGRRGILVRDCSAFEGLNEYYVRVAVLKREANLRLVEEIRRLSRRHTPVIKGC